LRTPQIKKFSQRYAEFFVYSLPPPTGGNAKKVFFNFPTAGGSISTILPLYLYTHDKNGNLCVSLCNKKFSQHYVAFLLMACPVSGSLH
jgi:hypothetical protein